MMKFLLLLLIFLLNACSESGSSSTNAPMSITEDLHSGMVRVSARNAVVSLGTDDTTAKSKERPLMNVVLDYDFSIAKHEVTCLEFKELMGSDWGPTLDCRQADLPATGLTYYDAVLFANARSRKENLEPAYTYSKAYFDNNKHCTNMEGFAFHPEVEAYRLPTEAEWALVAKNYWNPDEGWTAENSDYQLHKVCSKADSNVSVCDMVGNAMEWVNDWLGNFRDTTLTNFVGAPDGGSMGERVVKGGSYRNSVEAINLYSRGDVYTVTSSTRAEYVGFRLAFGAIPNATWMGSDGKASTSRVIPLANSAKIRSKTGTYKAKLAFRNGVTGNLSFIDYSSGILSVKEIADSLEVYHPEISPDGKRVAFCTRIEGVSGASSVYVRDLNAEGTNLVKLDVENAAIPRWRVLDNGDTVIVYVTDAGNNKEDAVFAAASTWQVKFAKGKFGKPEKLFNGAYHGGISEDNTLAVTGARLLRARVANSGSTVTGKARDTVWFNGEQACNVSLAKDGSKRTLFLDFAGETGQKFVGMKYPSHGFLFMADSTGKLVNSYSALLRSGYTFDHSEWTSGGENLAVASLTNPNGAHTKIILLDLSKDEIIELAEGEELWHPSMWVKSLVENNEVNKLDLDSACAYITVTSGVAPRIMKVKMDYFWKYRDTTELVVLGSSRTFDGVDPEAIKSMFAINMSYSAQDMGSTLFYIKNYILPLMPKLKVIVISLDYDRWYVKDENWKEWFANIPGYEYDKNHDYWRDGFLGDMYEASQNAMGVNDYEYEAFGYHRGLFTSPSEGWGEDVPEVVHDSSWFDVDKSGYEFNLEHLTEILGLARNYGVHVVGIVFPQSPNFLKTNAWGRYGLTRGAAKQIQSTVLDLIHSYPNFTVFDEYHDGHHDYSSELFFDEDHLSMDGALVMAARLDSLLKTLK
jgi:uncharacterized protein (TIGR02171 family)